MAELLGSVTRLDASLLGDAFSLNVSIKYLRAILDERVIMQAFVDESEGFQGRRILLLSACIQSAPVWANFSNDWQAALDAPPSIKNFHMREARSLTGQFAGWKDIDRDLKLVALTNVIMRHEPHLVVCWLDIADFNETMLKTVPSDLRNPYFKCFCAIVHKVAEYQFMRGITVPVNYVFDDKGDIGNEAVMWYSAYKNGVPPHVKALMGSTPVFRSDEEVLPLQAADLIAWHKRRRKEIQRLDSEVAATMQIDDLPGGELHLSREHLQETATKIAALPHVELFRDRPSLYKNLKRAYRKGKREI